MENDYYLATSRILRQSLDSVDDSMHRLLRHTGHTVSVVPGLVH